MPPHVKSKHACVHRFVGVAKRLTFRSWCPAQKTYHTRDPVSTAITKIHLDFSLQQSAKGHGQQVHRQQCLNRRKLIQAPSQRWNPKLHNRAASHGQCILDSSTHRLAYNSNPHSVLAHTYPISRAHIVVKPAAIMTAIHASQPVPTLMGQRGRPAFAEALAAAVYSWPPP